MGTISLPWIPLGLTALLLAFPYTTQRWMTRAGYFLMLALLGTVMAQLFWG